MATPRKKAETEDSPVVTVRTGSIQDRIKQAEQQIGLKILERTDSIHTGISCLFTRKNQVSVGDGTSNYGSAKTALNEQITSAVGLDPHSPAVFSQTLHEFSVPEMVRGAAFPDLETKSFSIGECGVLYPDVRVIRLGEVYNGKAILHYWNDILQGFFQEGVLGKRRLKKLLSVFADTNVFPSAKDPTAWALHDRFLFRKYEGDLKNTESFKTMIRNRAASGKIKPFSVEEAPLTIEDVLTGAKEIAAVDMPDTVIETLAKLRNEAILSGVLLSPRRWAESVDVLKYQAWYHGRDHVENADTEILSTVLWNLPADIPKMNAVLAKYGSPVAFKLKEARELSEDSFNGVMAVIGADANNTSAIGQAGRTARKKIQEQRQGLLQLKNDYPQETAKIDELLAQMDQWQSDLVDRCF